MSGLLNLFWYGNDEESEEKEENQDVQVDDSKQKDQEEIENKEENKEEENEKKELSVIVEEVTKEECDQCQFSTIYIQQEDKKDKVEKKKEKEVSPKQTVPATNQETKETNTNILNQWQAVLDKNTNRIYYWNVVNCVLFL